ncbi:MAG: hypothetical protein JSV04_04940 [Candidatus Heimdallarchaeota archaeon]|nr:MAG: hypothetical protein JSV04_04940 [Candidatus Heimdallarchaeota archaeon]
MSEQQIHVFVPSMDGEYVPVRFTSPEEDLKDTEVLIFLNEEDRQIFIWTGSNSSVRKRFISSQIARQIRLERGLTHRISTEDQGNETAKFWEFMDKIKDRPIEAKTLFPISPPAISTDLPDPEIKEIVTHPETLKRVTATKTQQESVKASPSITPPVAPPVPRKAEVAEEREEVMEADILYFRKTLTSDVPKTKANLLFQATDQQPTLTTLHISTAATEGKIALYSVPKTSKTTSCKTENPLFVIFLKPDTESIIELDDLNIPISAGHSIYFTCPAKTFIGINLEI